MSDLQGFDPSLDPRYQGAASPHPRHVGLFMLILLISRVGLARRLVARLAVRTARRGTSALERRGYLRKEGRVPVISLAVDAEVLARTVASLDRTHCALRSRVAIRFARVDEPVHVLGKGSYHPAQETLRQAHAVAVVFDLADRTHVGVLRALTNRSLRLAERGSKRRLPLLLLGTGCDKPGAMSLPELRAVLGPARAQPAPWEVRRVLLAGRHSSTSPFRLLPDELFASILQQTHEGSAWGVELPLLCRSADGGQGGAAMCCWEAQSSSLLVSVPASAGAQACECGPHVQACAPEGVGLALAHAVHWLDAQLEPTAPWAWGGPSPGTVGWGPGDDQKKL
ncbi:hypothetical protein T492DRAFT_983739 [Pavlovales sp. CCMP2436]|nr:hypothetical protein T492DRAFT_983739 [Pavlovales sp. CCMP2436]|eukprot:CAMPEP_0179989406 /NCGR_PEP_ID=MMETSP0984-20121128/3886_1 /TAXON_ID=483367 /ORGANISM="non described non described, Strain CCMP 2436" /LENGTH=339 /DNA_ID=CAMNT_0021908531 /DNA_START=10 /DNA_END=1029 /DNA_ORIENTATION=-